MSQNYSNITWENNFDCFFDKKFLYKASTLFSWTIGRAGGSLSFNFSFGSGGGPGPIGPNIMSLYSIITPP